MYFRVEILNYKTEFSSSRSKHILSNQDPNFITNITS